MVLVTYLYLHAFAVVINVMNIVGLDWGGVSREFFCILSNKCFDCSNGLFHRFKDDHQELVLTGVFLNYLYTINTLCIIGTSKST